MKSFLSGETITAQDGTPYFVKEEIGAGGYGIIFEATNLHSRNKVAIKTIRLKAMLTAALQQQHIDCFKKEIRHCSEFNHPNIVKLLNHGLLDDHHPFAVYEYVSGISLKNHITSKRQLSPIETENIMHQLLEALAAVHSKGIIHGDLKPQNIMLAQTKTDYSVKLFDFGSSTKTENSINNPTPLSIPTTIHYCSPEQLRNEAPTAKSDIYAWGLILLECLTGQPAIKGQSANVVIQNQLSDEPVPIPKHLSDLHLKRLIEKVTHKNASHRTDDIKSLLALFEQIDFEKMEIFTDNNILSNTDTNEETSVHHLKLANAIITL